jgi:hypothetical protein
MAKFAARTSAIATTLRPMNAPILFVLLLAAAALTIPLFLMAVRRFAPASAGPAARGTAPAPLTRRQILEPQSVVRGFHGGGPQREPTRAAVMDFQSSHGVATLVAFHDGSTSLLLANGSSAMGLGTEPRVRSSATEFFSLLRRSAPSLQYADEFPTVPDEHVSFWLVESGVTLGSGPISLAELGRAEHPFFMVHLAAQSTMAALRTAETGA